MKGTQVAKKHSKSRKQSNIARYFFGDDRKNELTSAEFLKFQENIQVEILKMEFDKLNPDEDNTITHEAFGEFYLIKRELSLNSSQYDFTSFRFRRGETGKSQEANQEVLQKGLSII